MTLRDVVFDLGGVLIDWDPRYLFRDHLAGEPQEVERFLAAVCTRQWHATMDEGEAFAVATGRLAERHPQHADWIRRYLTDWERMFAGPIPESVALLGRLRSAGYRLHALSNYPAEQIRFLYRSFPFMTEFDTVVLSGLVRAIKPSESLYRYVLERIGGRECLFIDDREENVAAAARCGMRTFHFVRSRGFADLELA